jgi:hypothetical protein
MEKNNKKTYWPHMIVGFLVLALTLSFWTVKSASSLPVQESNTYMLKYQMADTNINEITEKKMAFDKIYNIHILDVEMMAMTDNINSNRPQPNVVKLSQGMNTFTYEVVTKDGNAVVDANVTFLLTQPHSRREDILFSDIPYKEGKYQIVNVKIEKAGRYTLQMRAEVADTMGYSSIAAYLKP